MGKLIDAERLKAHYCWWQDENKKTFDTIIDLQPSVEAIPIEWILNHERMPKTGKGHDSIMSMIETWRGENKQKAETYEVKDGVRIVI